MTYDQFVELINMPQVLALLGVTVYAFGLGAILLVAKLRGEKFF